MPAFELQTWPLQSAEALAWSDDPAAANLDALDAVHIAYTLPAAPVIDTPAVQPNDERAQNSAAIEAESGSTAIESGSGSAVIGD